MLSRCQHAARCGRFKHYFSEQEKRWVRCPCGQMEKYKRDLGPLYCENPELNTDLKQDLHKNLILEGAIEDVRRHAAGAVIYLAEQMRKTWDVVLSQRLVEIWLDRDDEFKNQSTYVNKDLLILFVGLAELPNKRLPEVIVGILDHRALVQRPTWVHCALDFNQLSGKYGPILAGRLGRFERVDL